MASTFKTLLNDDVVNTRTLLHEAIPITGTIVSGTYKNSATPPAELNIKTYSHGMFESSYDYPYLSSSANHIFDVTYGYSAALSGASTVRTQNAKKMNIYNQFAQVLMGYDETGSIRKFDSDGDIATSAGTMDSCFFLTYSRLLTKDEVKKGSYRLTMYSMGNVDDLDGGGILSTSTPAGTLTLGDYGSLNEYRTSPAGDYGLIFTASSDSPGHADADAGAGNTKSVGLIFYQAGVVVLSSSFFQSCQTFGYSGSSQTVNWGGGAATTTDVATSGIYADRLFDYTGVVDSVVTVNGGADHGYADADVVYVYGDTNGTTQFAEGLYVVNKVNDASFNLTAELGGTISYADAASNASFRIAARGDAMGGGLRAPNVMSVATPVTVGGPNTNAAHAIHSGTIENLAKGFRQRWSNCEFNNTIELNSTIYFARVNHNEFNYSSNPTYVNGSKLVVKNNISDLPVSYITTVGLYSPDNELLAVAKLSEPLRKDPNTELTLRVRLDY